MEAARQLFLAYEAAIGVSLCFQNFEEELASLPGKYAPPHGELLLARSAAGEAIGCVALRPMEHEGRCEMKRLYAAPYTRGIGLGRALVAAIIQEARRLGYREICLDTLQSMVQAIALYEKEGFRPIEPYYDTPMAGTLFLARRL